MHLVPLFRTGIPVLVGRTWGVLMGDEGEEREDVEERGDSGHDMSSISII